MAATLISFGDIADAFLEPGLARLPGDAASSCTPTCPSRAAQHLDVLDRQIELIAALVDHFQAIMRLSGGFDGGEPGKAPNAVIGMDQRPTRGRHFGENACRSGRARASRSPRMCSPMTAKSRA